MSAARKLAPVPRNTYKTRNNEAKRQKGVGAEYIRYDTRRYRIPGRILFTVLLIFISGIGTALSHAYLQDTRMNITRTRDAIERQRAENIATSAEIMNHLTIEEIAIIASERLNMGPADASQIVRIYVPRQSYVVQSDFSPARNHENTVQEALSNFINLLGRLGV